MDITRSGYQSKPRWFAWAFALAIPAIGFGLWSAQPWLQRLPNIEPDELVTDEVVYGEMIHEIRGVGKLVSERVYLVSALTDGRVFDIRVLPGVLVEPNTRILDLVNDDLKLAYEDAKSSHDVAVAEMKTQDATLRARIHELQVKLAELESKHQQAIANLEVAKELVRLQVDSELKLKLREIEVKGLARQVEVSRISLTDFEDGQKDRLAVFQEKIDQAVAQMVLAKSKVDSLLVTANFHGVLTERLVEAGEQVTAGTPLAKLVDPRQLKAELKIPEVKSRFLQTDQNVTIKTHFGKLKGKVSRIDPSVVDGTVTIDVQFDQELPSAARPELSVTGTIEVDRIPATLHVGRPYGVMGDSDVNVYRMDKMSSALVRVDIAVGTVTDSRMQVLSGLEKGDVVVLTNLSEFRNATRLSIK